MKKALAAVGCLFVLWAILSIFPTVAQQPQFPQNLPPNTVVGRSGITAGPAQAIPFSQVFPFVIGAVGNGTLTNAMLANMPPGTFKCNATSSPAAPQDCTTTNQTVTLPDSFCTVDRTGATDMGSCISTTIAAAKPSVCGASSKATVYLQAGTYLVVNPVVPKSCVTIRGDGTGRTVLLTNAAAPFGPPAGQQLVHFSLDGVTFKDSGGHSNATAMTFPNIQDSRLTNLQFLGYSTGTIMSSSTSAVTSFDDSSSIWNNSNNIFNYFINWQADSCSICIIEAGGYGSTPTASPANSSNQPNQVVTQNRYDNIVLWAVSNKCLDFVKAADTEFLTNIFCKTNNNAAIVAQFGDDNANFPGNNYVSAIRLQVTQSLLAPATSVTMFRAGDWTYGHAIDLETDTVPSAITTATAQGSVTQFKIEICGRNTTNAFLDSAGFNTNRMCQNNDYGSSLSGQASYYRIGNGTAALPILGFVNDADNGIYLPTAGFLGFSKPIIVSSGGELFASLPNCSATYRGGMAVVTDSTTTTWGASVGGSGSNVVLAFCDGAGWTVAGK